MTPWKTVKKLFRHRKKESPDPSRPTQLSLIREAHVQDQLENLIRSVVSEELAAGVLQTSHTQHGAVLGGNEQGEEIAISSEVQREPGPSRQRQILDAHAVEQSVQKDHSDEDGKEEQKEGEQEHTIWHPVHFFKGEVGSTQLESVPFTLPSERRPFPNPEGSSLLGTRVLMLNPRRRWMSLYRTEQALAAQTEVQSVRSEPAQSEQAPAARTERQSARSEAVQSEQAPAAYTVEYPEESESAARKRKGKAELDEEFEESLRHLDEQQEHWGYSDAPSKRLRPSDVDEDDLSHYDYLNGERIAGISGSKTADGRETKHSTSSSEPDSADSIQRKSKNDIQKVNETGLPHRFLSNDPNSVQIIEQLTKMINEETTEYLMNRKNLTEEERKKEVESITELTKLKFNYADVEQKALEGYYFLSSIPSSVMRARKTAMDIRTAPIHDNYLLAGTDVQRSLRNLHDYQRDLYKTQTDLHKTQMELNARLVEVQQSTLTLHETQRGLQREQAAYFRGNFMFFNVFGANLTAHFILASGLIGGGVLALFPFSIIFAAMAIGTSILLWIFLRFRAPIWRRLKAFGRKLKTTVLQAFYTVFPARRRAITAVRPSTTTS